MTTIGDFEHVECQHLGANIVTGPTGMHRMLGNSLVGSYGWAS